MQSPFSFRNESQGITKNRKESIRKNENNIVSRIKENIMKFELSKSQWEEVGRLTGWMKIAKNADDANKYNLVDLKTYKTLDSKWMTHEEHVTRNRSLKDSGLNQRWDRVKDND